MSVASKVVTLHVVRTDYDCPEWCVRTDHRPKELVGERPPAHESPHFGPFWFGRLGTDGPLFQYAEEEELCPLAALGDAHGLRKIAADALAAAEWLDAHV